MRQLTKRQITHVFRGLNWLTPIVKEIGQIGAVVYEISAAPSGKNLFGTNILALTIRTLDGEISEYQSDIFNNMNELQQYLKEVKAQELLKS